MSACFHIFGELKAAKVTTDTIANYIAECKAKEQPNATINRALALLRRAFNLGRKHKPPLVLNPPQVTLLKENNVRKGFFEDAEYRALRDALRDDMKPVLTFAYYTGCRRAEILNLKWSQVDLQERIVRLPLGTTKSKEGRLLPMFGELHEVLSMQKANREVNCPDSDWVFARQDGQPIRDFRRAWFRALKQANLSKDGEPARLFHDLRRTGVRNLVRAGVPEKIAMTISGHKTRSVFERYNIVNQDDLKRAVQQVDQYLAN